ncbi:serine/threonine-protein kinase [Streptomyces angustmyceticus]|uniref:serine/threonine-protein kinase n=1 Tax=Streptomyces angustmyceticus TaxID=285578 RepID=UPI00344CF382
MGIFGGEGRLIGGRYRLEARLGRGGMGTVWRATDELLGRQVAVKELHVDDDADEEPAGPGPRVQRERAMREARTVAGIKHPNVIVVHDVVEQDGRPWIVMELVEGPSLDHRLRSGGPVAPREAARIGIALLGALRAAHTRGVLHRDLKPANVLMESGTGRVVLTDFGIAQVPGVPTLTDTGGFVGSPEYTAPERMSGRGTGPEADLWSLGVLLCAALSGASPFHRDSLGGVLHAVVYEDIAFPEAARALHAVVEGLLERDPERRLGIAETERLLRGYLRSGRAPERGHQRGPAAGEAEAAAVAGASGPGGPGGPGGSGGPGGPGGAGGPGRPGGPGGPRPGAGPHHPPRHPAPDVHDSPHDGPGDDLPSEHPPSETPSGEHPPSTPPPGGLRPGDPPPGEPSPQEDPSAFGTPPAAPAGPGRAAPAENGGGGPGGRAGGRAPGLPIPAALDNRALAAAARPHTGRLRTAVLVALAAVVIGGAGVAVLLTHRDGAGDGTGGPSPRASGGGTAQRPAPGSARPTAAVTPPPAPGATAELPAGHRLVHDPVGFVLAVPDGFSRSYENDRVYYTSRGRRFRIGVQVQKRLPEGPLGAMRAADAQGPAHYRGYRRGRVTETTHNGLRAGRWEFVWDGGATDGGPRYTDDLSWDEGGRTIDVWISSPVGSRTEAARHFDAALDAFRLTGT